MEKNEKLGYHKGALETLMNERSELARIIKIVDALIQYHASNMKQLGVAPEKFLDEMKQAKAKRSQTDEDAEVHPDNFDL